MISIPSAIGIFAVAALAGMYLLSLVLRNKQTPKTVAFIHGGLAATGIIILLLYTLRNTPQPIESLVAFILAAMGGAVLIIRDLTGKPLPKWLAIGHGLLALTGFAFLLIFHFSN